MSHHSWIEPIGQAVGPVERVCAPSWFAWVQVAWTVLVVAFVLPLPVAVFLFPCVAYTDPSVNLDWLWYYLPGLWALFVLIAVLLGGRRLRERLVLGRDGVAHWKPDGLVVVLWADLGSRWRRVPIPGGASDEAVLVLRHDDGTALVVGPFFADHAAVVVRVLEELARRVGGPTWAGRPVPESPSSEHITPDEPGIVEPDREQGLSR